MYGLLLVLSSWERVCVLPQEIFDDDFKLSGCFIPSSLNEGDLKKSLYLKILWKDISGVMIFAFPWYLDFQIKF